MDIQEAMQQRHSVRQYEDRKIEPEKRKALCAEVEKINRESGLHVQILFDEPKCFDSMMAHYGKFSGVQNYIALVGPKGSDLEEKCGYYGERLVLLAQMLGLNTCWVAMTHGKSAAEIAGGEKQTCLIALGYGKTQGVAHKSKPMTELAKADAGLVLQGDGSRYAGTDGDKPAEIPVRAARRRRDRKGVWLWFLFRNGSGHRQIPF